MGSQSPTETRPSPEGLQKRSVARQGAFHNVDFRIPRTEVLGYIRKPLPGLASIKNFQIPEILEIPEIFLLVLFVGQRHFGMKRENVSYLRTVVSRQAAGDGFADDADTCGLP